MAKHMAGKNQRPYSAEDRARRAAKADPRSAASELTPETLYAKQSSQSEKRVPSSIENLHFTPKSPKNGPEGFEETREYPAPAAPQQEAPRSARPAPAPAPRPEPYEDEDDYEEYEEYEEGYDDKPRQKRSPVVPIVIVMIVLAIGILGYIAYSLGAFGKLLPAAATPTPEPTPEAAATAEPTPTPTAEPTATPEPTPPPIYDDGTEGHMSSGILIYNNKGFEMFYGSDSMATAYAETLNDCASQLSGTKVYSMVIPNHSEFGVPERVRNYYEEASQRENTMAVNNTLSASITAVDIYDALNLHNNEDIYFDTDTHWGAARRVLRV